jgi:hypothetical protein
MFIFQGSFHGSCGFIDGVVCSTRDGAFIAKPGSEWFVMMQIIAHIRSNHSAVRLDGTLPEDHLRRQRRSGSAIWRTSLGQLIVLTGQNS